MESCSPRSLSALRRPRLALALLCGLGGLIGSTLSNTASATTTAPITISGTLPTVSSFDGYRCSQHPDACATQYLPWNSCGSGRCSGDAPDPNVVYNPGTQEDWAFSTGTALGNNIQVLVAKPSFGPGGGYHPLCPTTLTGDPNVGPFLRFGSSPFEQTCSFTPIVSGLPSWAMANTTTSPDVVDIGGTWTMYFDAVNSITGRDCLAVAIGPKDNDPTARPFFALRVPTRSLLCDDSWGLPTDGVIDPAGFTDPTTQQHYLLYKSNDGGTAGVGQPAIIYIQPMGSAGRVLSGPPVELLYNNTTLHPWEQTVENPSMIYSSTTKRYYLMFSGGLWDNQTYSEGVATCTVLTSMCSDGPSDRFLHRYTGVDGPGGGSFFVDATGSPWVVYAGWAQGCDGYGATGCLPARHLFVVQVTLH